MPPWNNDVAFIPIIDSKSKCSHNQFQGFWYFAWSRRREIQVNPRNPAKFTKTCKIPWNSVEILSTTCLYNIFETYLSYWGYLLDINLQIYLDTSSLKRANNVPKLPGVDYVAKNWALAMMLKALPLVHFWSVLLLKEQMMTSVRKTLKMLVWSAQTNRFLVKFALKVTTKSALFTDCFSAKFALKISAKFPQNQPIFLWICPQKSREIWLLFPRPIRSPASLSKPKKIIFLDNL